ncbi:hypothetical protein [Streptomyces lunaelactis]|uniref:hypothetical protein n=1 Tax=Streptomyces lunaelactis TaxID=1535768 RepID=UPI0015857E26|nr:hypothetical protein [Streptomyces lunaelactis]NUK19811.1 hypothetical protein [Streptomyces lunaelactis]
MTRDEQPIPPVQLAPGAITRGGAEKTTVAASPEFVDHLRALAERDGGKLLPGKTEADAALFAALTAPAADRVHVTDFDGQAPATWDRVILDTPPSLFGTLD